MLALLDLDHGGALAGDERALGHQEDDRSAQQRPALQKQRYRRFRLHCVERRIFPLRGQPVHHHQQMRQSGVGVRVFVRQAQLAAFQLGLQLVPKAAHPFRLETKLIARTLRIP